VGDDGADCDGGLVYFWHDIKYRERVFRVHHGVAMTKEVVLAFRDVAGLGVFFDPIGDVFLSEGRHYSGRYGQ
jgi:hypothetical protein